MDARMPTSRLPADKTAPAATPRVRRSFRRTAWRSFQQSCAMSSQSDCLGYHLDRPAGAFRHANAAALAVVVIELEAVAGPELDYGVIGADAVAVVALEAIAAGKTATCLEQRIGLVEPVDDLVEGRSATGEVEHRPHRFRRVGVIPGI